MPSEPILLLTQGRAGDRLGARLAPALRARFPDRPLVGVGGPGMEAEGVRILARTDTLSVMGWTGVLPLLPRLLSTLARAARGCREARPAAVVAVDFWQPLSYLHRRAPELTARPHVCYMPPGPNFTGESRLHGRAAARFHTILTPFPHQARLFEAAGARVRPAAHLGMVELLERYSGASPAEREPVLALLPGSRELEVRYGLPVQWAAARELLARRPGWRAVVGCADAEIEARARRWCPGAETVRDARALLARASFALICSGTAVLEAALLGCPGVVTYHGSPLQRWEWRTFHVPRLARLREAGTASPYVALPNILTGRELYPELLDAAATAIVEQGRALLEGDLSGRAIELAEVRNRLYWDDAPQAVASAVEESLRSPISTPAA